ncbi:YcaO-like family protein (plasmid) [Streptomyces sp. NBC_00715]|uniref:YcaO-like family protein n=1 Tax=Streptomyces sp. NBC_00715 TaxID=2975811 RepID=UPI002F90D753
MAPAFLPPWWHNFSCTTRAPALRRPQSRAAQEATGGGRSADAERAWRISAIEALERLANGTVTEELLVKDAASLPTALDLDDVPRYSACELEQLEGNLTLPDKTQPIRWAQGIRVVTGEPVHIPAVMTRLGYAPMAGERFWMPISTGVAAGSSWESALASGIYEVIERDMVSVTWLQRLALPRVDATLLSSAGTRLTEWCARKFITVHLFDATSEIGVPTVYCVLEAPHDPVAGRLLGAAAGADLAAAAEHALSEAMTIRLAVHGGAHKDPAQQKPILKGAIWLGAPDHAHALDFLLADDAVRPQAQESRLTQNGLSSDADRLRQLVALCEQAGHPVYAIDLTTPELRTIGLHVASAVIPSLQPLAFPTQAQYRAHPRLYRLPELLGHPVAGEEALNPHPQPFA